MSCRMVDAEHINVLIWAALHTGGPGIKAIYLPTEDKLAEGNAVEVAWPCNRRVLRPGTESGVGQMLVDANARSVGTRYNLNDSDDEGYVYEYETPIDREWSPVELLSAVNAFEYQACEVADWRTSEAKLYCDLLRRHLEDQLPGAANGPWTIDTETRSAAGAARVRALMERNGLRVVGAD